MASTKLHPPEAIGSLSPLQSSILMNSASDDTTFHDMAFPHRLIFVYSLLIQWIKNPVAPDFSVVTNVFRKVNKSIKSF